MAARTRKLAEGFLTGVATVSLIASTDTIETHFAARNEVGRKTFE